MKEICVFTSVNASVLVAQLGIPIVAGLLHSTRLRYSMASFLVRRRSRRLGTSDGEHSRVTAQVIDQWGHSAPVTLAIPNTEELVEGLVMQTLRALRLGRVSSGVLSPCEALGPDKLLSSVREHSYLVSAT